MVDQLGRKPMVAIWIESLLHNAILPKKPSASS